MSLPRFVRGLLFPLSLLYGGAVKIRMNLYDTGRLQPKRLRAAVISVGNLSVGGTGKTPMVLWLAERLSARGRRVGILSRGYRGRGGTSDEIELLKRRLGERVVFGIGPDRYRNGREMESRAPVDLFLLDDGFQHRQLARDLDILMLDGSRDLSHSSLLPAGRLREPLSACRRADVIVLSKNCAARAETIAGSLPQQREAVFQAHTRLLGLRRFGGELRNSGDSPADRFFAFCGIGNPEAFFADLERWQLAISGRRVFADHHKYSPREIGSLFADCQRAGATALVTTEKDSYNLPAMAAAVPIWIAVIDIVFSDENELLTLIERKLAERGR